MKIRTWIAAALAGTALCTACCGGAGNPPRAPKSGLAKYLWFDAEANFQRFSTKEGITAMLD